MNTKMKSRGNGTLKIGSIGGKPAKVKIKPISFSELLAGKVHDGSKTVTRRVVTINSSSAPVLEPIEIKQSANVFEYSRDLGGINVSGSIACPYSVGQLLYVREPWQVADRYDTPSGSDHIPDSAMVVYPASDGRCGSGRHRLPRFMPARFARTFLRVTEVRCERLEDISEGDAIAEGVERVRMSPDDMVAYKNYSIGNPHSNGFYARPSNSFASLWDSINKKGPKFADNPWVWVVSFERVDMPNPWNSNQLKK